MESIIKFIVIIQDQWDKIISYFVFEVNGRCVYSMLISVARILL